MPPLRLVAAHSRATLRLACRSQRTPPLSGPAKALRPKRAIIGERCGLLAIPWGGRHRSLTSEGASAGTSAAGARRTNSAPTDHLQESCAARGGPRFRAPLPFCCGCWSGAMLRPCRERARFDSKTPRQEPLCARPFCRNSTQTDSNRPLGRSRRSCGANPDRRTKAQAGLDARCNRRGSSTVRLSRRWAASSQSRKAPNYRPATG